MIRKIFKYTITPDKTTIEIPKGAEVLHIGEQFGSICIWAEVDPEAEKEERVFEVFGTGHLIAYDMGIVREYISTVKLDGGLLIFHIYERFS